jgi:hypothetical protein
MPAVAKAPPPELTLADRYRQAHHECCTLAEQIISERVRLLKLAHPGLPEVSLRMDIVKHRGCLCLIANEVLETNS